jgi:hypothetical protein
MKLGLLFAVLNGLRGQEERRPNAAYEFNGGRDVFAQSDRNDDGNPLLSVNDLDLENRLPRHLRCSDPMIPNANLDSDSHRIVGGYQAEREAWPFIVKIRIGCGGTIVSNNWVITAAHCCRVSNNRFLDVTVGEWDRGAQDVGARTILIKQKIIHPDFVPATLRNDICLLELSSPVVFSEFAQPACFPKKDSRIDQVALGDGAICYVAGWGRLGETKGTARILQETQVPIINNTVCDKAYIRNHVREDSMLCAGYAEGGIDACQGDSGGPMICVENNQPVLRGVVSWGIGCARKGLYGVYARTSSYVDWVRGIVNPDGLNAAEIATTVATTTQKPTKRPVVTTAPGEKTSNSCGDPRKRYRLANNVKVGCSHSHCAFRCPDGMKANVAGVKCISRKKQFAPKKIKKGVHCMSVDKPATAGSKPTTGLHSGTQSQGSNGGFTVEGASSGGFGADPAHVTTCGNVQQKFKINLDMINIDCKKEVAPGRDRCNLRCMNGHPSDESMWTMPTLPQIMCKGRPGGRKRRWAPKKAKVSCKSLGKSDTRAEETCGYLPVLIDAPAEYFCEGYTCHFYCANEWLQPNRPKLTCNPKNKKWWPKRVQIFCH